jgi:hypothetical protein
LSKSFDPSHIAPEPEAKPKGSQRAEDVRPEVEVVDDERFWAKIPVIREKKKRASDKNSAAAGGKKSKTG